MVEQLSNIVLCVAPHPDDETLGCGGSLLRHKSDGDQIFWLIVTEISEETGFTESRVRSRAREIEQVTDAYGFDGVYHCNLPTAALDTIPKGRLVDLVGRAVRAVNPNLIYTPYRNDVHSDHAAVFDAVAACSKSFRYPSVKSIYAYETLSETEFGIRPDDLGFRPNLFVDITKTLDKKISIMSLFEGEMGEFPFPRSEVALRALASLRGSTAGVQSAEAFMILREYR